MLDGPLAIQKIRSEDEQRQLLQPTQPATTGWQTFLTSGVLKISDMAECWSMGVHTRLPVLSSMLSGGDTNDNIFHWRADGNNNQRIFDVKNPKEDTSPRLGAVAPVKFQRYLSQHDGVEDRELSRKPVCPDMALVVTDSSSTTFTNGSKSWPELIMATPSAERTNSRCFTEKNEREADFITFAEDANKLVLDVAFSSVSIWHPTQDLPPLPLISQASASIPSGGLQNRFMDGIETPNESVWYYEVEFKRLRRGIFVAADTQYSIGDYVKVEADRGLDAGQIVQSFLDWTSLRDQGILTRASFQRILGPLMPPEMMYLHQKYDDEAQVVAICRWKVQEHRLPMHVVDAEFQFDRRKLTFFFHAEQRIDFRNLVRDLFSVFRTRIWLEQLRRPPSIHP